MISVVVPTYHRPIFLDKALSSICAANALVNDVEIIVCDNGHDDETTRVVKKYSNIRYYRHNRNIGPYANWKFGLAQAQGAFVKFLFSDDILTASGLRALEIGLSGIPFAGAAYGAVEIVDADEHLLSRNYSVPAPGFVGSKSVLSDYANWGGRLPFSLSAGLFRRHLLEEAWDWCDTISSEEIVFMGAGPDIAAFLFSALRYEYVYAASDIVARFTAHPESFSIAYREKVRLSYQKVISEFINNYLNKS